MFRTCVCFGIRDKGDVLAVPVMRGSPYPRVFKYILIIVINSSSVQKSISPYSFYFYFYSAFVAVSAAAISIIIEEIENLSK